MGKQALDEAVVEACSGRLFEAGLGGVETLTVYLGDRLGYYEALSGGGLTPGELAERTGTYPRYAREWLEQQAVMGILRVDDLNAEENQRRYGLPEEHAEVLVNRDSLAAMAWFSQMLMATAFAMPAVLEAFRTGGGVPWSAFGPDGSEGQMYQNRPLFEHLLTKRWLPSIPEIDEVLRRPGARVADVACGAGGASLALARDYPDCRVDGFDLDAHSIALARENAEAAGFGDRVSFEVRDAADPRYEGRYDLALAVECVHDLAHPVEVLRAMRGLVGPKGAVIVIDEKVAETFTAPGDEIERLMYGYSVLCCLATGMSEPGLAQTGTVMRSSILRRYALEAGFSDVEILPIEHPAFRVYRLAI